MKQQVPVFCRMMCFVMMTALSAGQTLQTAFPVTNGQVKAVTSAGTTVYLGGSFTHISPYSGTGIAVNTSTSAALSAFPVVNGTISAVAEDGAGGFYIGGEFTTVGGSSRSYLARINADGSLHAFAPTVNGSVSAIAVSSDNATVYIAGSFTEVNAATRKQMAALSATDGTVTSWNPGFNGGQVNAILLSSAGTIYAAGSFTAASSQLIGDSSRYRIAEISLSTGVATAWNPQVTSSFTAVYALAQSGSSLFIGGDFTQLNGSVTRNRLAKISKATGAVDASWNPNADYDVRALVLSGSRLFVGGSFFSIGGTAVDRIAAVDTVSGTVISTWKPSLNGEVRSLALSGNTLVVGGSFTAIGDSVRYRLGAIDVSALAAVSVTDLSYIVGNTVNAVAVSGTTLFVGGDFRTAGGKVRKGLAAVNGNTGEILDWDPFAGTSGGTVNALVPSSDGSTVYVGGSFSDIGGSTRNNLAKFATATGNIDASWDPNVSGSVEKMSLSGGDTLFFYGYSFTSVNGSVDRFSHCAAVNGSGTGTVTAFDPNGVIPVTTRYIQVSPDGSTLYLGYNSLGVNWSDSSRSFFAALNTTDGTPTAMDPGFNQGIFCSAIVGDTIYFGGQFVSINGDGGVQKIAKFIASAGWSSPVLDASWNNSSATWPDGDVRAILPSENGGTSLLYLGGGFHALGATSREHFGAIRSSDAAVQPWDVTADGTSGGLELRMHLSTATKRIYLADLTNFTMLGAPRSYIAAVNGGNDPLPVVMSSISATPQGTDVIVRWSTVAELGNSRFEVLRRGTDGRRGSEERVVGSVPGNGTTNTAHRYEFVDESVSPGIYSYRLRQIDHDGRTTLTAEITVTVSGGAATFSLGQNYPNPFNPVTTIEFTVPSAGRTEVKVYSMIGAEVATLFSDHTDAGEHHRIQFDARSLSSGTYLVRLTQGSRSIVRKVTLLK